jgi:hypothetical protein
MQPYLLHQQTSVEDLIFSFWHSFSGDIFNLYLLSFISLIYFNSFKSFCNFVEFITIKKGVSPFLDFRNG